MKITATGDNPLVQTRALTRRTLKALKVAVAGATDQAKTHMRDRIRLRSSSPRLPNIIGSKVFPAGDRLAYNPVGMIYARGAKAELILQQMASGEVITARNGRALAIPVHNQRGANGTLLRPRDFQGLQFIPSRRAGGSAIGVLALPASKTAGRTRRSAARAGASQEWVAMFILVRTVRLPKVFDPAAIVRDAEAQMPRLFEAAFAAAT